MTATEAEIEVTEYLLGLEALGGELGRRARQTFDRAQIREVRPCLVKQRALLEKAVRMENVWPPEKLREIDAKALALDEEISRAWARCLEQLKIIWLTSGRATEDIA